MHNTTAILPYFRTLVVVEAYVSTGGYVAASARSVAAAASASTDGSAAGARIVVA